jgi:DeoR/GlpR family transcriptional regulator of sugar metabolism
MERVSESILHDYPYPIAKCYERLIRTRERGERWDAIRYLFEVSLKYAASVAIAQYLQSGAASAATNGSFACLARPSLGHWLNLLRLCVREASSAQACYVIGPELFERRRNSDAIKNAVSAIRGFLAPDGNRQSEAVSSFAFAELLIAYRNRSAGHGAPDRRHIEEFAPLLEPAVVDWLETLGEIRRHPLVHVSEIRVERRRFVHTLTRLMGTTPVPMADYTSTPENALIGTDRTLFLADPETGRPNLRLHPIAILAHDDVFLLQKSDLEHTVQYLCHHTGATYTADHIYEDFREQFAKLMGDESSPSALDTTDVYAGVVRMSLLDGVIADEERVHLEDMRVRLELPLDRALEIEESVRTHLRRSRSEEDARPPALQATDTLSRLAQEQHQILRQIGAEILDYIGRQPDPSNPIRLPELALELSRGTISTGTPIPPQQLARLIADIQHQGLAPGLVKKSGGYCIAESHIAFKVTRDADTKRVIARAAAELVGSGTRVGLDGGSTTLPIAEELVELLDAEILDELTIVTNSLPVAQRFADFVERRGWSDRDSRVRLLLAGGLVRPVTKAVAEMDAEGSTARDSLLALLQRIDGLDLCFIGGNGITAAEGITMPNPAEIVIKRLFLEHAKEPYIVADASKFGLRHAVRIAGWEEDFRLLTNRPSSRNDELKAILELDRRLDIRFVDV